MPSKLDIFFAEHPVFTVRELDNYLLRQGSGNVGTRQALLAHHQRQGHIRNLRRGLYASVPTGSDPKTLSVDPFLLATRLARDTVLGYHAALAFHGQAYSLRTEYLVISPQTHVVPLTFQGNTYRSVLPPTALVRSGQTWVGVETAERAGLPLAVTSLERTLVDVLDRPDLAGGWEEIWRSFEGVAYLDINQVITYSLHLDSSVVAGKVGYFLEQHREVLGVTDDQIGVLRQYRPKQPRYITTNRQNMRFVSAWNLMVPQSMLGLSWGEVT